MKPIHLLVVGAIVVVAALFWLNRDSNENRGGQRSSNTSASDDTNGSGSNEPAKPNTTTASGLTVRLTLAKQDGEPADGATVSLFGDIERSATADEDGALAVDGLEPGFYVLQARLGRQVGSASFALEADHDLGTITLREAVRISGRVLQGNGEPLSGAIVQATDAVASGGFSMTRMMDIMTTPETVLGQSTTGADGAYELFVPARHSLALRATARGYGQETEPSRAYAADVANFDFRLFPGAGFNGQVLGEGDIPIAGARVMHVNMMQALTSGAPKAEVVTDGTGKFALVAAPSQQAGIVVRAQGYAIHFEPFRVPRENATIRLTRGLTARMKFVDPKRGNAPIAGIEVMLGYEGGFGGGTSNDQGELVIERLPKKGTAMLGQRNQVIAWGGLYVGKMHGYDTKAVDGLLDLGTIEMEQGGVVTGKVIDAATRKPIPGAGVMSIGGTRPELSMLAGDRGTTDQEGKFKLTGVSLAASRVIASHADYVSLTNMMELGMAMQGGKSMFPEGKTTASVDVELTRAAVIRGIVVGPDGKPVAGALVRTEDQMARLLAMVTGSQAPEATTDAEGRFEIRGAKKTETIKLIATHRDFASSPTTRVKPGDDATLSLAAPAQLKGKIVNDAGEGVGGVRINVDRKAQGNNGMRGMGGDGSASSRTTVSLADGSFEVRNVATGDLKVSYEHAEFKPGEHETHVPRGTPSIDIGELRLERGPSFHGLLVDANGSPVANVTVTLSVNWRIDQNNVSNGGEGTGRQWGNATTDKEGKFSIFGLRETEYNLHAGQEYHVTGNPSLKPREARHRLELKRAASYEGVVRGPTGPVAGARVTVESEFLVFNGGAVTDRSGKFTLNGLSPDEPFTLEITHKKFKKSVVEGVTARDGGRAFMLEEGLVIAGQVVDATGKGLAGMRIQVFQEKNSVRDVPGPSSEYVDTLTTDANGNFERGGLEPGELQLSLAGRGMSTTRRRTTVQPGNRNIRLEYNKGATIIGYVLDAKGEPMIGVSVQARDADDKVVAQTWVNAATDGRFELDGLKVGRYTLVATQWQEEGKESKAARLPDVATGTDDVELRFD